MISLFGKLWWLLSLRERRYAVILILAMIIGAVVEVIGIGMIVPFITILANPEASASSRLLLWISKWVGGPNTRQVLVTMALLLLGLVLVKNAYLAWLNFAVARFVFTKEASISSVLLRNYLLMPYSFHLHRNTTELLRILTSEVSRVTHGLLLPALTLIAEGLVMLFIIALLALMQPLVTLAMLVSLGVLLATAQIVFRHLIARHKDARVRHSRLMYRWAQDALSSIKEIKILGRERFFLDGYDGSATGYSKATQAFTAINQTPRLLIESIVVSGLLLAVIFLLSRNEPMREVFVLLALFAVAAARIMPSATRITTAVNSLRFYAPAIDAVSPELSIRPPAAAWGSVRVTSPPLAVERVIFDDVHYRHEGMPEWILRGVSFEIKRGETIALAGASGAGKSTLGDLLLGLIEPTRGKILINGIDLHDVKQAWQRCVGFVPQDINLLDDTVRCNVAFGMADHQIDDARIWQALEQARLADRIRAERSGLDMMIGEQGARLSGGERQRLGIARALYHDPGLLVLDEATSALDNRTEIEIADTLLALRGEKTILIVAHRLDTLKRCKRVLLLADGRIEAEGSYDRLMVSSPTFAQLTGEAKQPIRVGGQ